MKMLQPSRRAPGWSRFRLYFWWTGVAWIFRRIARLLYRAQVVGVENIPHDGAFIYISNHQSHFDPPVMGCFAADRPPTPIARRSLLDAPVFGRIIKSIGIIPIDRDARRGDLAAMKAGLAELERGAQVLLFPEGTRTPDGTVRPFRKGAALIITRSKVPIVPVALEGVYDVFPKERSRPYLRGWIGVAFGEPIPPEAFDGMDGEEILESIRHTIEEMRLERRATIRAKSRGRAPRPGPADQPYWELEPASDAVTSTEDPATATPAPGPTSADDSRTDSSASSP